MAIRLEYCNIIVPIQTINKKLGPGTFESRFSGITDFSWHDEYLFREGCMDDWVLSDMLDEWEGQGLTLTQTIDGQKHWQDLCVANSGHGPSYPCQWLDYDPDENIVWLKGHERGTVVGPKKV